MRIHTICKKHGTTALIGPGSLISELECVVCIEEYDQANTWRPCCSAYNTTCCGHDEDELAAYESDRWALVAQIDSPNYCDGAHLLDTTYPPF